MQQSGKIPPRDLRYVDIYREKQIRVTVKVLVPVREHPKVLIYMCAFVCNFILKFKLYSFVQFNFVGKLLGPKGNSMKRLQEETMCKMAVLGRGSMKDRKKVLFSRGFYSLLLTSYIYLTGRRATFIARSKICSSKR